MVLNCVCLLLPLANQCSLIFVVSYSFDASPHAPGVRVFKVTLNALSVLAFGLAYIFVEFW